VLFDQPPDQLTTDHGNVIVARDPRTRSLGWRVITDDLTHVEPLKEHLQITGKDLYF
jgi:hypothetical protein